MISYGPSTIRPAPFVSISKSYQETPDSTHIGSVFNVTLEGEFLPWKGSPTSSGTFWPTGVTVPDETVDYTAYMTALMRKQEAMRLLFATEGRQMIIQGDEGGTPIYFNPRIKKVNFPAGNPVSWAQRERYSIEMETDVIYFGGRQFGEDTGIVSGYRIESAENNWNIEVENQDLKLFRLTHNLSAKGKRFYNSSGTLTQAAWQNARDWVIANLGLDSSVMFASGVLNLTDVSAYNYWRTQNEGQLGGTFGVNETWLCYYDPSGFKAYDEFDMDIRQQMNGQMTVGVKGKIQGLESQTGTSTIVSTKFANASGYFYNNIVNNLYSRATAAAKQTLHTTPLSGSIGWNPISGTITYNYEYDNRPTVGISSALSETISVDFDYPTDVFAELTVLGREAGPVIQSIQTVTSNKKTVTVDALMPVLTQTVGSSTKPDTNALLSGYVPSATFVKKHGDRESWNPYDGKYRRAMSWTFNN